MNSLLYYYNNVQKMAAYRQAKRMQCGVKLGENQSVGGSTTAKFVSNPIPIGTDDFTVEFYGSMCGSNVSYASLFNAASPSAGGDRTFSFYSRYYPNNGIYGILFSPDTDGDSLGDQVVVQYEPGDDSKFLVSVTRQGTTVKVYINGELKATKEQSEAKDLGDLQLAIANSSDVGFVRVWNYALSADEIATLYNNGDPMGYVVPKAMRGEVFSYLSDFTEGTDGWKPASGNELSVEDGALVLTGSASSLYMINSMSNNDGRQHFYSVELVIDTNPEISRVTCFAFQGSLPARVNNGIDNGDGTTTYSIISPSELRTYTSTFQFGFDMTNVSPVKIRSIKLKTALCLAEYLPQNLMFGRDDKTIATSWLDSAKQLPLSDESMEPLFQSVGGYDMAANGAPEILYNE